MAIVATDKRDCRYTLGLQWLNSLTIDPDRLSIEEEPTEKVGDETESKIEMTKHV